MATTVRARVVGRESLSADVVVLTFEAVAGRFECLEPGAHLDVHLGKQLGEQLGEQLVRSYSLTDWDDTGRRVSVAVKAEPEGRGGSLAMHRLAEGEEVAVSGPRNAFPLVDEPHPVVLLGGGIGITPLYAMARRLVAAGADVELHYFVRERDQAAFDGRLTALGLGDRYLLRHDDVHGLPDFWRLLEDRPAETRYYVCGPELMLDAVTKAGEELGRGVVRFERFGAPPLTGGDAAFDVVLGSSGQTLRVEPHRTILDVLRAAGHDVDYSCGEGTCGTCILDVLEGDVDHRDGILTEAEQQAGDCLCICVSRAWSPRLVLDL